MDENRKFPQGDGPARRDVGQTSGGDEVREAILGRVGHHFLECRGLPVRRVGDRLDFDGKLDFGIDKVQVAEQGMVVDYSLNLAAYPGRTIAQPVAFPGSDRERNFLYCVQMLTDGVLAPALTAVGFELPEDDVKVLPAASVTDGQAPVNWDFFRGVTLVYTDTPELAGTVSRMLNDKLYEIVFSGTPNLMAAPTLHWWKVFYSRFPNGNVIGDLWYDDYNVPSAFQAVCALDLPPASCLMFRQFGLFRPSDRPADPELLGKLEDARAGRPDAVRGGWLSRLRRPDR